MTETTPTRDEAVPTGWKFVPVEPTEEMIEAMREAARKASRGGISGMTIDAQFRAEHRPEYASYAAMLASAPAPASGGVDAVAVKALATSADERKWWAECDVIGTADARRLLRDVESLIPYRDELLKIAADVGEPDDPFAAWETIASLSPAATPGWPDPLTSPQAEAIRAGKIDDTSIRDLFDQMERELKEHRARAETPVSESGNEWRWRVRPDGSWSEWGKTPMGKIDVSFYGSSSF